MAPPARAVALPDNFCPGNDRLDDAINHVNCDLPAFYPASPVDDFDCKKCTSNRNLTGAEAATFEKKWKNLMKAGIVPIRIEMGLFDAESAQAAYLGFQGPQGLNDYVYFVDNPVAEIFGPLRKYLNELEGPKRNSMGFMSYVYNLRQPQYDRWAVAVLEDASDFSVPGGSANDAEKAQYWAILAAVFRGLKQFPRLLVETDERVPKEERLTPHVRGHSMEDYHRLYVVFKQFMKRRRANNFKMTAPARNHAQTVLCWYRTSKEIKVEPADGGAAGDNNSNQNNDPPQPRNDEFGARWALEMEKLKTKLNTAGVNLNVNDDAFARYQALDNEEKEDFAYQQLDAVEQLRLQIYQGPDSNVVAQNLAPMTSDEKKNLMKVLETRIENLTEATGSHDLRGRLDDPRFVEMLINAVDEANDMEVDDFDNSDDEHREGEGRDDDLDEYSAMVNAAFREQVREGGRRRRRLPGVRPQRLTDLLDATPRAQEIIKWHREQHQNDFIKTLDHVFGGNDSGGMSMERARKLTGFDWERPTLIPGDPESAKMLVEGAFANYDIDVAAVVEKLLVFPHGALLSSACGIGKTFEALATIVVMNRRTVRLREIQAQSNSPQNPKDRVKFYPSLWLCPSTLVRTAYEECVSKFQGLLTPKIYYGSKADFADNPAASVLESHAQLLNDLSRLDPDDPKYISSYFTFKRRSMKCTPKLRKNLTDEDRVHLALHLSDSPSSRRHEASRQTPDSSDSEDEEEEEEEGNDEDEDDGEDPDDEVARRQLRQQYVDDADEPTPEDQREEEEEEQGRLAGGPDGSGKAKDTEKGKKKKRADMKYRIFSPLFDQRFNVVVCDEAHILKNKGTASHKTVKVLKRNHILHVTATPMLNHPKDVTAYLLMMWPKCEPTKVPTEFSYRTMYGMGSELNILDAYQDVRATGYLRRAGDALQSALHKAHQGNRPFNRHHKLLEPFIVPPATIPANEQPSPIIDESDVLFKKLKSAWEGGKRPVWLLNPCNFYWASRELGFQFEACREMILPMLQLISVRRGLQTVLVLPNGVKTRPADSIPGARFRVVDVQYKKPEQEVYDGIWNEWKKKLFNGEVDSQHKKKDKPRGKDLHQRPGGEDKVGMINMRAVRRLTMPGFCLDNEMLLEPRDSDTFNAVSRGLSREQFETMVALNESSTQKGTAKGRPAAMGTEEVQILANMTNDGGASWLWAALTPGDSRNSPPNSRYQFVRFLCWNSPILCAMILQISKWLEETNEHGLPNKVVCMSMMPWVQQDVTLVLQMMGWEVLSIRSEHSVAERSRIIAKFNDPNTGPQILSTSMDLSAWGLNLHASCCKGIVVQWPWSANQLIQILGRLPRISQKRWVEWVIYNVPGTMYHRMQSIVFSKYVHQLAIESKIPKSVRGFPATIAGYSLIQGLFNMPHHLVLCDRTVFDLDACWIDKMGRPQRMAKFFEVLGLKLLADTPNSNDKREVRAYEALMERGIPDFVGGAFMWMLALDSGQEPRMTWQWLESVCTYSRISTLSPAEKLLYIHPDMDTQLRGLRDDCADVPETGRPAKKSTGRTVDKDSIGGRDGGASGSKRKRDENSGGSATSASRKKRSA
ncbi:hypothetical protein F4859DRAFT_524740 [Xylaria cf. heliscus]|nr:hypothetical protein F4859DRAFT_524740 [Xylaria cf. heliscus]